MEGLISRRIFFWVLVIFFAVTTLVVVFYALGYRFNLERGIFIYGGSVTVKTNPRGVDINLDGQPVSQKKLNFINNSYHIDGIRPGEYLLEVKAQGFKPWSKKISVHSGVSTEFWNIQLVRDSYDRTLMMSDIYPRFFTSPNNKYICAIKKDPDNISAVIIDMGNNESSEILKSDQYYFADEKKENIEWSPQSSYLIVPAIKKDSGIKDYLIVNVKEKTVESLSSLSGDVNISNVRWDTEEKELLYYLSQNDLYSISLTDAATRKKIATSVSSYDFASGNIYYFQLPSGIIYEIDGADPSPRQITTSPPAEMENPEYKIVTYDKDRIAFINLKTGNLFIWNRGDKNQYFRKIGDNIDDIQFSDDGKKLLFWNSNEIFVYFTRDWNVQPTRVEDEIQSFTRYSAEIQNVHWATLYEHVIFTTNQGIKIIELDRRHNCNTFDILSADKKIGSVVSNFSENKLFFTAGENEAFGLLSIDFPEKEGILGF